MMTKIIKPFFVLLLAASAISPAFAALYSNVLLNAGFELGASEVSIASWTRFGNTYRYADAAAHGGDYSVLGYGNWWPTNPPAWNGSGVYQDHPAHEGDIWEATVWARTDSGLQGRFFAEIQMSFLNAASQSIYEVRSPRQLTAGSPTHSWTQLTAKAKATRNTAYVRIRPTVVQSPSFEDGSVWFDDASLQQVPTSTLHFAGREWTYTDGYYGPGPNFWSTNSSFVDEKGWLHLKLQKLDGQWHCGFVESPAPLGFGEYRWHLANRVDRLDSNLVLGLFTYAQESVFGTNQNEVDIEISHAFPGMQTNMLIYTIQPYTIPGNSEPFPLPLTNELSTYRFVWRPDQVFFESYHGHSAESPGTNGLLTAHVFRGRGIPIETNEAAIMNLWLFETNAPANTQEVEVIISDFAFIPFNGFILLDDFADAQKSNAWETIGGGASVCETNGRLIIRPPANGDPAGYATRDTIHRNERGVRYVFSAQLASVTVSRASSGDDVRALMTLSAGTSSAWQASAAAQLEGRYDQDTDTLTMVFSTKTNAPGAAGAVQFEGTLAQAAGKIHSPGGVELQIALDPQNYEISVRDANGRALALQTNQGAAFGLHRLVETVNYGYWLVGAQNSGAASTGAVEWSRAAVGVDAQAQPTAIEGAAWENGRIQLTFPGAFNTRYGVYATTSSPDRGYACVQSNRVMTKPMETLTIEPADNAAAIYRIGAD